MKATTITSTKYIFFLTSLNLLEHLPHGCYGLIHRCAKFYDKLRKKAELLIINSVSTWPPLEFWVSLVAPFSVLSDLQRFPMYKGSNAHLLLLKWAAQGLSEGMCWSLSKSALWRMWACVTLRDVLSPIGGEAECREKRLRVNSWSWSLRRVYHNSLLGAQRGPIEIWTLWFSLPSW